MTQSWQESQRATFVSDPTRCPNPHCRRKLDTVAPSKMPTCNYMHRQENGAPGIASVCEDYDIRLDAGLLDIPEVFTLDEVLESIHPMVWGDEDWKPNGDK